MSRLTTRRKMSKPPFWAFPLVSASTWLGNWSFSDLDLVRNQLIFSPVTLVGLLAHWFLVGQPRYGRMEFDQAVP